MISWILPTFGRIIVANGLFPIILKLNVGLPSRTKRFAFQFLFCAIFAIVVAFTVSPLTLNRPTWIIFILGFVNGFAAFTQWKAIDISLSKTSLFTFWDDIIAMSLSYFILNERQYLTPGLYIGIGLSLGTVILFAVHSYRQSTKDNHRTTPPRFFLYVGFYSLIWGIATFLMRYFGVAKISSGSFLVPWYIGAFMAALVLLTVKNQAETATKITLKVRDVSMMLLLALSVFISLALAYTAYRLAPQNVVQPFFLVGEMIFPTLIGLYIFAERKDLDRVEKFCFLCAIVGGSIIAINAS